MNVGEAAGDTDSLEHLVNDKLLPNEQELLGALH